MPVFADNPYNPNPVTKLFATILFGVTRSISNEHIF